MTRVILIVLYVLLGFGVESNDSGNEMAFNMQESELTQPQSEVVQETKDTETGDVIDFSDKVEIDVDDVDENQLIASAIEEGLLNEIVLEDNMGYVIH